MGAILRWDFTPGVTLTNGNAAGERGALSMTSRWGMGLHDTVVQQVSGACIGERCTLKLRCVHLVNETGKTETWAWLLYHHQRPQIGEILRYSKIKVQESKQLPALMN